MDLFHHLGMTDEKKNSRARSLARATTMMMADLKKVRLSNNLTQSDVAQLMGTDTATISRIESGERDIHLSTLRRYAWAVGATLSIRVEPQETSPVFPEDMPQPLWNDDLPLTRGE